ncbi:hypothetical protein [Bacillus sp. B15-48]|uniref:maleate cis-trans isomerase family protein n=1 Tax=Bacillus sp. B15-48 TaxID=1548601 RepID=UPI00193EF28B|nr:hypothetical protein [Bacillus sp. B15-48]MBM4764693.1 arylmalonate decarboxylase [Bacillus sp. B15-48]
MSNAIGFRMKAGVLAPSTNTTVESDFNMMAPYGVTFHMGRIHIKDMRLSSDDLFENLLDQVRREMPPAIERVMTCRPSCMVMGMSGETFVGGREGNIRFEENVKKLSNGLKVYSGASATHHALQKYGAKTLGIVTPYQLPGDEQVVKFFTEYGYEVKAIKGLKVKDAVAISEVTEDELRVAINEVNLPDVDAIIQCGTNLSMVRLADGAERYLGKPVIAINAATLWHALRGEGIMDKMDGFGRLFREF